MAEQNNELLMKNHETRPSGSNSFPEVNATSYDNQNSGHGRERRRGHGYGYGHGKENYGVQFKNMRNSHNRQERGDKDKGEIDETKKCMPSLRWKISLGTQLSHTRISC
jgi:hypothetical protein